MVKKYANLIISILLALPIFSCSNPFQQQNGLRGEFRTIEVQPVSEQIDNILKNGSFIEWLSGSRVPSGFLPPFSQYSYIIKKPKKEAGFDVVQKWIKPDANVDIINLFRIMISDLQPGDYIFIVNTTLTRGPQVNIGIWKISEPGKPEPYIVPLIEIKGEENKPVSLHAPVRIEQLDTPYIFASYTPDGTPAIIWSDWILISASKN
ncbi:MAG TPA: hypothetical protein PLX23_12165 [Candidatus Hydrogenedens sp.]|nr:hypothetical protein [Candidatus Hydrogenedens sp.]